MTGLYCKRAKKIVSMYDNTYFSTNQE